MRRAAIYGVPTYGAEWQQCYSALLASLTERFGEGRVWQRTTKYYEEPDVAEDVAVAIVHGLRGEAPRYLEHCLRLGIPTLVVDLGWLRRDLGYWSVSPGALNVAPPTAPSSDRFDALNFKVYGPRVHRHCAVLGQLPGDAQHDLRSDGDMRAWAHAAVNAVHERWPRKRLFWRPHPSHQFRIGRPAITSTPNRTLNEFVREEDVGQAVVYNSTAGLELLRLGVHVVAQGPKTVYTELTTSDIGRLEAAHPGADRVRDLLVRLAYGQYQLSELRRWETLERLLDLHNVTGDW